MFIAPIQAYLILNSDFLISTDFCLRVKTIPINEFCELISDLEQLSPGFSYLL